MKVIKGILTTALMVSSLILGVYWAFEPEINEVSLIHEAGAATTTSAEIDVILTVTEGITLQDCGEIDMDSDGGAISVTQDDTWGVGSSWVIKTNSTDGYTFTLKTSSANCLTNASADQFTDYTPASAGTPDAWSVASGAYEFGFSVCGADADEFNGAGYWGTASTAAACTCGTSTTPNANLSWLGFNSTNAITVATSGAATTTSGTETTLCVAAEQDGIYAPNGAYTTDVTGTAACQ